VTGTVSTFRHRIYFYNGLLFFQHKWPTIFSATGLLFSWHSQRGWTTPHS